MLGNLSTTKIGKRSMIYSDPNKFARQAGIEYLDNYVIFHGYQEFVLTQSNLSVLNVDLNLQRKYSVLSTIFTPRFLQQKTVLDLGANSGFFSYWAIQNHAEQVTAVDIDENYLQMINDVKNKFGFQNLSIEKENVIDWNQPADVVIALALVHWIYSCTAVFGSLEKVFEKFAELTKEILIVEWVDPSDSGIQFFKHLDWNKESVKGPYTLEAFEQAMKQYFCRYELLGEVSPTRKIYIAYKKPNEIDLSGPLPILFPKERIISSRLLSGFNGIAYWSCVYDGGDVIHKQATLDLAAREGYFLAQLTSSYFPNVLSIEQHGTYSLIVLEKVDGIPFMDAFADIRGSTARSKQFFDHCLQILEILKTNGITHRDIRPGNILVRNNIPVLIDFGWAVSDAKPLFVPPALGATERPKDGSFSDVFSMGKTLKEIFKDSSHSEYEAIVDLMCNEEAQLRITDIRTIRTLLALVSE